MIHRVILVATCIASLVVYGVVLHHGPEGTIPSVPSPSPSPFVIYTEDGSAAYGANSATINGSDGNTHFSFDSNGNMTINGNLTVKGAIYAH